MRVSQRKTWATLLAVTSLVAVFIVSFQGNGAYGADVGDDEYLAQPVPVNTAGMQSGIVTGGAPHSVQISGRDYGLMPDVLIVDQKGARQELTSLVLEREVFFNVRKDKADKIDKIVVIRPQ
ncbi:MAG: hypothetical protein E8D41_16150 [Nitrospira sp.]|nr:MAG: hypothetical protein E8D41_16150 [Nitrospira sp.]